MTPAERLARLRLARTPGIGPLTFRKLIARFHQAKDAIDALPDFSRDAGRPTTVTPASAVEAELNKLAKLGGQVLVLGEAAYPAMLAMLPDAPPVIAVLGDAAILQRRAVGLVGARNASANGQRMAETLAAELAGNAILVVSGMARGIDSAAHTGAMHTGFTAAAVAGGLDQPYPPENAALQARIAERGVVIAEAPLGTAPQSRHFPRRNRIIAGLSLGVVVVEAARHSGTLITAQLALDAGRAVMAVPGSPLDPRCHGSNDLIRGGATLVAQAADVLEALPETAPPTPLGFAEPQGVFAGEDGLAAALQVRALLGADPVLVDDLIRRCQLPASAIMAALQTLELDGVLETLPGHRVALLV